MNDSDFIETARAEAQKRYPYTLYLQATAAATRAFVDGAKWAASLPRPEETR